MANAPAVFVGTVTNLDNGDRTATVHVQDVWKGESVAAVVQVVGTPDVGAVATSVDRTFAQSRRYLFIPATGDRDRFMDNSCTATQPYTDALAALRPSDALGAPPTPRDDETSSGPAMATAAVAGLVAGGLCLAALRLRRRRQDIA